MQDAVERLSAHFPEPPAQLGLAVSGGSDSVALLCAAADWAARSDVSLRVFTVDHGLRDGVETEINLVADVARRFGVPHEVLRWQGWDGQGNLQDRARLARYDLLAQAAQSAGIAHIALAHTADDQAETVLMRLARGAGVDGLSGMRTRRAAHGIHWHRPFLSLSRDVLRADLRQRGQIWADDPSNDDPKFTRIALRQAWTQLHALGLTSAALGHVAQNMADAQAALDWQMRHAAHDVARECYGAVVLQTQALKDYPAEIVRRLILAVLAWVGHAQYPPRRESVQGFIDAIFAEQTATLDGCQTVSAHGETWVFREYQRVKGMRADPQTHWDGCWKASDPVANPSSFHLRALGPDGLSQLPNWRDHKVPRPVLLALPSVFDGDTLVAAPPLLTPIGWHIARSDAAECPFARPDTH